MAQTYKDLQHEPMRESFCRWGPKAKDGEGGWVAVALVPIAKPLRMPKLVRAFEKVTRPKPLGKKVIRMLRSKTIKKRELDGEPTLASVKRARLERTTPGPVIRRALWQ